MFKKVIGQNQSDPSRNAPTHVDNDYPTEVAPTPAAQTYASPQAAARTTPASATRNILSSDVEIKGTMKFTNDLIVDGKIEGEIFSDGNLTIGENARIKAEIKTATIVVYGKVHGNLTATDRIELKASAEVVGDIKAKVLSIEAGAIFIGKSTVGTPSQTPAATSSPAPAATPKTAPSAELPQQGTLAGTIS